MSDVSEYNKAHKVSISTLHWSSEITPDNVSTEKETNKSGFEMA
jgi:hypothetical protein